MLADHYQSLERYTRMHYLFSVVFFIILYIVIVALSIPGASLMTLLGGFLFGVFFGGIWVVLSATVGATITFLAVKTAFAERLKQKAHKSIQKMQKGFQENEFNYLLFLRLLPIFPFFIINIAAGVLGVSLRTFVIATLFGIIPGTFIYAWVGSGLGFALSQGNAINSKILFAPQVLFPMIALAVLSIVPILYKQLRKKSKTGKEQPDRNR